MKNIKCLLILLLFTSALNVGAQKVNIIPYPDSVSLGKGFFNINKQTVIVFNSNDTAISTATEPLFQAIKATTNFSLKQSNIHAPTNCIFININSDIKGNEAYDLEITTQKISIKAKSPIGIFYAIQSLLQLPANSNSISGNKKMSNLTLPVIRIIDEPAFSYRGLMLDVARHFMPIGFVKKLVDIMSMQKMNNLHLHLTDDQGWRIEIKKYPLLTSIGGFRNGTIKGKSPGDGNDNTKHGGYYSQEEIKDLVAYARKKYINIIPEIELPGHASAAIAAYPALSCFPEESSVAELKTLSNQSQIALKEKGKKIVQESWGVFQDVFSPTEYSFHFIENILDEVCELFPSTYIHIGGDECPKESWKRSAFCQQLIKEKGLKDENSLQSYFIQRVEKYLNKKGKSIIGWDEILEGGLAANANVMSWRGESGGIEAAKQSHNVIMTPLDFCYFNFYQSTKPNDSIAWGGFLPLEKVYNYHPIPAALTKEQSAYIIGLQCNLWTEYVTSTSLAEYMLFPRAIALSGVGWTKNKPGFNNFVNRLTPYLQKLNAVKLNYSKHLFNIKIKGNYLSEKNSVAVEVTGVPANFPIYYATDTADFTLNKLKYNTPFLITGKKRVIAGVVKNGIVIDEAIADFSINKATGQSVDLVHLPSKQYNQAGNNAWVNGVIGSNTRFNDNEWLGWNGKDFSGIIHFNKVEKINAISIRFFNAPSSWVYMPAKVKVFTSMDGQNFLEVGSQQNFDIQKQGVQTIAFSINNQEVKHLKIVADNFGVIPKGKPGEGSPAWLFVDEVQIH